VFAARRGSVRRLSVRDIRRAGAAALVVTVICATSPAFAARDEPGFFAGAATIEVALPRGTPLGGYGGLPRRALLPDVLGRYPYAFWFRPSVGVHDPIKIRGLVLESGHARVLWLALDLVGIDP